MKTIIVDEITEKRFRRRSIIAFIIFFTCIGVAWMSWKWLYNQPLDNSIRGGIQKPLRKVLDMNMDVYSGLYSTQHLVKEYPKSMAAPKARVNGNVGMDEDLFDTASWKLTIIRAAGDTLLLTLNDLKKLHKIDVVHNFKCIEGWSQITWWSGVRFSEFAEIYKLTKECQMKFASLVTPDEEYYVGIDMPSMMHPQTILCFELNGKPLPMDQGYPLRLIIPVKYGVKNIKRIGTISFHNDRPADYWAERGYDYYTGL